LAVALGVGTERRPEEAPQRKSLSAERTFAPTSDRRIIEAGAYTHPLFSSP